MECSTASLRQGVRISENAQERATIGPFASLRFQISSRSTVVASVLKFEQQQQQPLVLLRDYSSAFMGCLSPLPALTLARAERTQLLYPLIPQTNLHNEISRNMTEVHYVRCGVRVLRKNYVGKVGWRGLPLALCKALLVSLSTKIEI